MNKTEKRQILLANLSQCEQRCHNEIENLELHLLEFWEKIIKEYGKLISPLSREDILTKYLTEVKQGTAVKDISLTAREKIIFARQISSLLTIEQLFRLTIPEYVEDRSVFASPVVAFWPENSDSSATYDKFRHLFRSTSSLHVKRFSDVCDEVSAGNADFGIIPIENSSDGKLFGFYRMLERGELEICATCDIEHIEMDIRTKYALISKSVLYFDEAPQTRMELSFYSMESRHLFELMTAMDLLAIKIEQISSLPPHHQTDGVRVYTTISVNHASLAILLCYLWLFETDYSVLGLFIHIEKD